MSAYRYARCRCGHLDFGDLAKEGHFRAPSDTGSERRGPCRQCDCLRFDATVNEIPVAAA